MTDKTLDGYCCKKDAQGNPHTFYIEQFTIPVLLEDCAQGEGVKYYLASIVDKRISELERQNIDDAFENVDLKLLKKSPWEFAFEICSYHEGQASFYQAAFFKLLEGETESQCVKTAQWSVHETRRKSIRDYYSDAKDFRKRIKQLERQITDLQANNTELVLDKRAMKSLLIDANEQLKEKS